MTLDDFINKYKGFYVGKNGETGSQIQDEDPYIGQCVSIVKWYLTNFGQGYNKRAYGNAKDYVNLPYSSVIAQEDARDGDLVVWTGGDYGHIGILYNGSVFSQNPFTLCLKPLAYFDSWGLGEPHFVHPKIVVFRHFGP